MILQNVVKELEILDRNRVKHGFDIEMSFRFQPEHWFWILNEFFVFLLKMRRGG
jgi:hypothetical protein